MGRRMNYFDRQFLRAEDFQTEQAYHLDRRRQHNQGLFRPGVGDGLLVERTAPDRVRVTAGWALDSLGHEIVLTDDREEVLIDAASAVEIWIRFREEPTEPVSYLGASEQRFTRVEEEPELVVVAAGDGQPADALRLAVIPADGDPDNGVRLLAGPRPGSVDEASLADGAVTSRAVALADGESGQETGSGSGVKTGHIQDGAVTSDKLADDVVDGLIDRLHEAGVPIGDGSITPDMLAGGAVTEPKLADNAVSGRALHDGVVSIRKLETLTVSDVEVSVPGRSGSNPGFRFVGIDRRPPGEPVFYFISVSLIGDPTFFPSIRWEQRAAFNPDENVSYAIFIENFTEVRADVRCVAERFPLEEPERDE